LAVRLKLRSLPPALMRTAQGNRGAGVPLLLNEKTEGGARTGPHTCRPWPGSARRAFRWGRPKGEGKGGAAFDSPRASASPTSPGPVACCRVDRRRSVQARRVAGGSKCVASARAGHFGPEAMRVCAGKDQRRIMDPLCDRYGGVALIRWRAA